MSVTPASLATRRMVPSSVVVRMPCESITAVSKRGHGASPRAERAHTGASPALTLASASASSEAPPGAPDMPPQLWSRCCLCFLASQCLPRRVLQRRRRLAEQNSQLARDMQGAGEAGPGERTSSQLCWRTTVPALARSPQQCFQHLPGEASPLGTEARIHLPNKRHTPRGPAGP